MKTNDYRQLPTQFAPDVEFDVVAQDRAAAQAEFEQLESRLLQQHLVETGNPALRAVVKHAANEAAALAWTTPYPLLMLPVLFEEKARATRLRAERQNRIQHRSRNLAEAMTW